MSLPIVPGLALALGASAAYDVDWAADGVTTGGMAVMVGVLDGVVKPTLKGGANCARRAREGHCDPSDLSALDRLAVDNESRSWGTVSDIGLGLALATPLVTLGLDSGLSDSSSRWKDWGGDSLVMAEAVLATVLVADLLKFTVRRPRPTQYGSRHRQDTMEHQLSFFSGHTATAAAAMSAMTTKVFLRHPGSPWRWASLGGSIALTGVTAYGRVADGMHFPTDVIVGAVMGGSLGFVLPWLHRKSESETDAASGGGSVARAPMLSLNLVW